MLAPADQPPLVDGETDLDLLSRYRAAGDQDAFAEIVRRYASAVFSTALRILGDRGQADDVSQETFFRLSQKPDSVKQSLGGWLHTAATRLSIDALRSETSRAQREIAYQAKPPSEATTWAEISPHVDRALAELPEATRTLLVRHFLQNVSQCQLAGELKTSPATISRRIKSAVDALRQQLAKRGVIIAAAALLTLLREYSASAAPAQLMIELGKITMLSGGKNATAPAAGLFTATWGWIAAVAALGLVFATLWFTMWNKLAPAPADPEPPAETRH